MKKGFLLFLALSCVLRAKWGPKAWEMLRASSEYTYLPVPRSLPPSLKNPFQIEVMSFLKRSGSFFSKASSLLKRQKSQALSLSIPGQNGSPVELPFEIFPILESAFSASREVVLLVGGLFSNLEDYAREISRLQEHREVWVLTSFYPELTETLPFGEFGTPLKDANLFWQALQKAPKWKQKLESLQRIHLVGVSYGALMVEHLVNPFAEKLGKVFLLSQPESLPLAFATVDKLIESCPCVHSCTVARWWWEQVNSMVNGLQRNPSYWGRRPQSASDLLKIFSKPGKPQLSLEKTSSPDYLKVSSSNDFFQGFWPPHRNQVTGVNRERSSVKGNQVTVVDGGHTAYLGDPQLWRALREEMDLPY